MKLLNRPDLLPAQQLFARAYHFSRRWDRLVALAVKQYGDVTGTHVSGVYSQHFPPHVQDKLRKTARAVSRYSDAAWKLRPKCVRNATMRALKDAVIGRDGKGYYG